MHIVLPTYPPMLVFIYFYFFSKFNQYATCHNINTSKLNNYNEWLRSNFNKNLIFIKTFASAMCQFFFFVPMSLCKELKLDHINFSSLYII